MSCVSDISRHILVFDAIFMFLNILERMLITLNAVSFLIVISVVQSQLLVIVPPR